MSTGQYHVQECPLDKKQVAPDDLLQINSKSAVIDESVQIQASKTQGPLFDIFRQCPAIPWERLGDKAQWDC